MADILEIFFVLGPYITVSLLICLSNQDIPGLLYFWNLLSNAMTIPMIDDQTIPSLNESSCLGTTQHSKKVIFVGHTKPVGWDYICLEATSWGYPKG